MKTMEAPCPEPAVEAPHACRCLPPCDIAPFCRNHYFTGKLLTARDLLLEQRYGIDKLRLHHLALHGWGVVCGLRVKPHPHCPDRRVIVEPGLAIDACGREVLVPCEVELELPRPVPPPPEAKGPCPPEPSKEPRDEDQTLEHGEQRPTQQRPPLKRPPTTPPRKPEPGQPPPAHEPCPDVRTVYVCLRYDECETERMPAPFDECGCNDGGLKPNRICEGYCFELLDEKPEVPHECPPEDCHEARKPGPCPKPDPKACLFLATLGPWEVGTPLTESQIDDVKGRRVLPSVSQLDKVIECLLEKLPALAPTRIKDIGWTHGGEYTLHDFATHFVGSEGSAEAFEVTFEAAVRPEGLSPQSFQAVMVHRAQKGQGLHVEVVPAKVWHSPDRTRFYLKVDPGYVQHCDPDASFDLYLRLQCNLIVDDRGIAVDGDLMGRLQSDGDYTATPPTGDGIPGGAFESWIHVEG